MKKKLMLGLVTTLIISAAVSAPQLDQSNLDPVIAGTAVGSDFVGQVISTGASGVLTSVDFSIRKFEGFTFGDVTLQIRDVTSGIPNSTILGFKIFSNTSISPGGDFTTFDLQSLNLEFNAGDSFAIVVTSANHSGSPFPIALSNDVYVGGLYSSANGTSWFPFAGNDARFRTFVEDPVQLVDIDIKPGSDPNSINLCSNGAVPVAILGSNTFDVLDIDTESLRFAEASIKVVGKKDPIQLCSYEDINDDFINDLVCHFVTQDIAALDGESSTATVNGELLDGTPIEGSDSINIVKDTCN